MNAVSMEGSGVPYIVITTSSSEKCTNQASQDLPDYHSGPGGFWWRTQAHCFASVCSLGGSLLIDCGTLRVSDHRGIRFEDVTVSSEGLQCQRAW